MRWLAAIAAAVALTGGLAQAAGSPGSVLSTRTERGGNGHIITTVAFLVNAGDGNRYLCVVSEDDGHSGNSYGKYPVPLALAQSCDFSVGR